MSKKSKKRGEERKGKKSKSQDYVEILLSAYARTSLADVLHLDQKAVKSTTGERVCAKFQLFIAWQ